jgi:hypothetical protein
VQSKRERGFASTLAIVLIGLVGVTLVTLSSQFAGEAKRATRESMSAQLRQMLLAGSLAARDTSGAIELPQALKDDGGMLTVTTVNSSDARKEVDVEARLRGVKWSQRVVLEKDGARWRVASVVLSSASPVRK